MATSFPGSSEAGFRPLQGSTEFFLSQGLNKVERKFSGSVELSKPNMFEFESASIKKETILTDQERVAQIKAGIEKDVEQREAKEITECLIKMLYMLMNEYKMLGKDTSGIAVSDYDMLVNKVHMVADPANSEYIGLAMDMTFGDDKHFQREMRETKNQLIEGHLVDLRYFKHKNREGSGQDVPRIVLQIDRATADDMMSILLRINALKQRKNELLKAKSDQNANDAAVQLELPIVEKSLKDQRSTLSEHPLQLEILHSIQHQLQFMIKIAIENKHSEIEKKLVEKELQISKLIMDKETDETLETNFKNSVNTQRRLEKQRQILFGRERVN